MQLGILGTGHVATTLAAAWSTKHEITLGSRDPAVKDVGHRVVPLAAATTARLAGLLKTEAFNIRVEH
jgi:predicted dinucleotide-binding enzyme